MMADKTYLDLFETQVKERGGKVALSDPVEDRSLTFAELDDYAGRVAAKMRDAGVASALHLPRLLSRSGGNTRFLRRHGCFRAD